MNEIEKAIEHYKDNLWHMEQNPQTYEDFIPMYKLVAQALQEKLSREENKALTVDELKLMDGKPIYVVYATLRGWAIITDISRVGVYIRGKEFQLGWMLKDGSYGKSYLAYRNEVVSVAEESEGQNG